MAYANGFQGDSKALDIIIKTLDAKTYAIPGVIVNPDTQVSVAGEIGFIYTHGAATAAGSHTLGTKLTPTSSGVKRIDISLAAGYGISAVIPYANFATVGPDVVEAKVAQEALKRANLFNVDLVTAINSGASAKTYTKGLNSPLAALLEAFKTFKTDNKDSGLKPTGVLASVSFYNGLLSQLISRNTDRTDEFLYDGDIIMVGGVPVVEAVDLPAGSDFVVVNAEGVAAPVNIKTLFVTDGTAVGYPGSTLISGEMGRGFKVLTSTDAPALGVSGYYAAKFTEAT